jgi:hypothetical protein
MSQTEDADDIITIEGADGTRYALRILGAFNFEGQDYGVFTPAEILLASDDAPKGDLTIMQIVKQADGFTIREVADEQLYQRVAAHARKLVEGN